VTNRQVDDAFASIASEPIEIADCDDQQVNAEHCHFIPPDLQDPLAAFE
jgi:hypothetical protein